MDIVLMASNWCYLRGESHRTNEDKYSTQMQRTERIVLVLGYFWS
jgi:hypothetical protein